MKRGGDPSFYINNVDRFAIKGADAVVVVRGGLIESVGVDADVPVVDLAGCLLMPGFVDIHNHGAAGVDVNEADADGLLQVGEFLAGHGVTAWVPTLVPDTDDVYARVIAAVDEAMERQSGMAAAQIAGVHYEGVFANGAMCGALRPEYFKKFTGAEHRELPRLKTGVHMMTLAPEIEGGIELIESLVADGWVAALGHTNASVDVLDRALVKGARHVTHFFNAMSGVHHRDLGVAGWALANDDVTFDIIADGIHVHPGMLKVACRTKTPERVSLISDSIAPTGLGDGEHQLWGQTISVENGRTRNAGGAIAGSVITMADGVRRMMSLGFSASEVAMMASGNPAAVIRMEADRGSIEVGKRADIVALDSAGVVKAVFVGGRRVK